VGNNIVFEVEVTEPKDDLRDGKEEDNDVKAKRFNCGR